MAKEKNYSLMIQERGGGIRALSIMDPLGKTVAIMYPEYITAENKMYISFSRSYSEKALTFYRNFRQSPARLLLFLILTKAKEKGITDFIYSHGIDDKGMGFTMQHSEGIFDKKTLMRNSPQESFRLGDFPKLDTKELREILSGKRKMPEKAFAALVGNERRKVGKLY